MEIVSEVRFDDDISQQDGDGEHVPAAPQSSGHL